MNSNSFGAEWWEVQTKGSLKCLGWCAFSFFKKMVICGTRDFMTILDSCFEYPNYSLHIKLYRWLLGRIMFHKLVIRINIFSCWNCCLLLMVNIILMSLFSFELKTNSFHCPMKICVGWFSYKSAIKKGMIISAYSSNFLLMMFYKHSQRHLCREIIWLTSHDSHLTSAWLLRRNNWYL